MSWRDEKRLKRPVLGSKQTRGGRSIHAAAQAGARPGEPVVRAADYQHSSVFSRRL